ncbi:MULTISPECIES: hypothetical protein [unclassified Chelatococcus]|uniref:hypothetical protein n=1 Tax=unclassified Chelatococcus TaxID=2638111 RepID=UPI000371808A|nr:MULTISPECIES: hypothetical protein [unclassified Chelatococcus]
MAAPDGVQVLERQLEIFYGFLIRMAVGLFGGGHHHGHVEVAHDEAQQLDGGLRQHEIADFRR